MRSNLYWAVYKALEKECLELADNIHIDDNQLKTYSTKISNLLIRTCIEIESIAKDLYVREGGEKTDKKNLYFDTDCLAFLDSKWNLGHKVVMVTSPLFYLSKDENIYLRPLHKAHKYGEKSSDWKRAYQAVKHDRAHSLTQGNMKHLVRSLGALFLLNVYYNNIIYSLGKDASGKSFDTTLGSAIFSIVYHECLFNAHTGIYTKMENYDDSTYILQPTNETRHYFEDSARKIVQNLLEPAADETAQIIQNTNDFATLDESERHQVIDHVLKESKQNIYMKDQNYWHSCKREYDKVDYEMVLNVCQL